MCWQKLVTLALAGILLVPRDSAGFNLEPRLPVIYEGQTGSYFGYSVAAHMITENSTDDRKPR